MAAAGYGPETVIEDAPGSLADMSIGLMFHGRLECCLGSHSELASVRLDSIWIGRMDGIGWGRISRETRKSVAGGRRSEKREER